MVITVPHKILKPNGPENPVAKHVVHFATSLPQLPAPSASFRLDRWRPCPGRKGTQMSGIQRYKSHHGSRVHLKCRGSSCSCCHCYCYHDIGNDHDQRPETSTTAAAAAAATTTTTTTTTTATPANNNHNNNNKNDNNALLPRRAKRTCTGKASSASAAPQARTVRLQA